MKQICILLSYVFNDYLKTCKLLEIPIPSDNYIICGLILVIYTSSLLRAILFYFINILVFY
jgi:hypothetical protein